MPRKWSAAQRAKHAATIAKRNGKSNGGSKASTKPYDAILAELHQHRDRVNLAIVAVNQLAG